MNGDILNKQEYKLRRCWRKSPQVRSPVQGLPPPQLAPNNNRRVLFNLDNLQNDDDRGEDSIQGPCRVRRVHFWSLFEDRDDDTSPTHSDSIQDLEGLPHPAINGNHGLADNVDPPDHHFDNLLDFLEPPDADSDAVMAEDTDNTLIDHADTLEIPLAGDNQDIDSDPTNH